MVENAEKQRKTASNSEILESKIVWVYLNLKLVESGTLRDEKSQTYKDGKIVNKLQPPTMQVPVPKK
jgi:hypothetical protein